MSGATSDGRPRWFRPVILSMGTTAALYGCLGLLLNLHLPQRLVQGIDLWRTSFETGSWPGPEAVYPWNPPPWFEAMARHFDQAVLWVWLAWGLGVLLLLLAAGRRPAPLIPKRRRFSWRDGVALAVLAGIVLLAYFLRARFLLPLADGTTMPISHYDEMVYLEATLLWQQGLRPYVDFFLAHPPGILYAFWVAASFAEAWGGPVALAAGRWSQLLFGLGSVILLYLVAREAGGRRGGLLAALVLAVDVQAAYVAPLETVVNLATVGSLALYIAALRTPSRWDRNLLLAVVGGCAVFSGLTKAPGALALLLLALLALLAGQWWDLLAGAAGAATTALLLSRPFAGRAPLAFFRQVVGFQLLRPQETFYGRNHLARMADYPESRLTFLLLIAGLLLLTGVALAEAWGQWAAQRRGRRAMQGQDGQPPPGRAKQGPIRGMGWAFPLILTIVPLLALFSYGRAYHSRYYVQMIVPFALLLSAGLGAVLSWARRRVLWVRILAMVGGLGLLALFCPHLVQQRMVSEMVRYDGTYGPVGQALRSSLAGESWGDTLRPVFALDPGYPLMAGRPPAYLPDGTYLVDGAGLMIYRVLGVAGMSPGQIWASARQSSREIDLKALFHQPAAQDLAVSALYGSAASVIDPRIAAENLTPQTQEFLATRGRQIIWEQYTAAFSVDPGPMLGRNESGLNLWDLNMRALTPQGEGPAALPGEVLVLSPGDVLQASLYWLVAQTPPVSLKVGLELRDTSGQVVARLWERPHFGDPPTHTWLKGWVYQDHHNLVLPSDLQPGDYTLHVTLMEDSFGGAFWPWAEGVPAEQGVAVGTVRLAW